jgi:hypothetical protein
MAKAQKPRTPTPRRADLAQPLLDKVLDVASERPGELDIEPLLVALRIGALDDHLDEIGTIVNNRIVALNAIDDLRAASRLHVGDRVRLGHNLKPRYLHGREATIIARDGDKWVVRLDEPVGRFTNADIRLRAIQLDPA